MVTNQMIAIEDALLNAAIDTETPLEMFRKCDESTAFNIIQKTKQVFVEGNPSVWWFNLKYQVVRQSYADGGFRHLLNYIPEEATMFWFIPEIHEEYPLVYEASRKHIIDIIGNCIGFDYYIISKSFEWLIAETDADEIIVAQPPKLYG